MTSYLISGATGFVGKSLTHYLTSSGNQVTCISRDELADGKLKKVSFNEQPILIHCAWAGVLGLDRNSHKQNINEEITNRIIRIAETSDVKTIIAFGSQAEYGNPNMRIDETHLTAPSTLYGELKVRCHNILRSYLDKASFNLCWIRLYDPYGPGDNPAWFMPYVIRCALQGESPKLTECTQYWDYIYIDDLCRCIKMLAAYPVGKNSTYNLSSDNPVQLRDVVDEIYDYIRPVNSKPLYGQVPFRADQIIHLQGSNEKLKANIGWEPHVSIEEGIKSTIDYFISHGFG
jgi:UDP-glucose 4-epimerase